MKTVALVVLLVSSTLGCSTEPASTADAPASAERDAQIDRILADFKPAEHDAALRLVEKHVASKNWSAAQKQMALLRPLITPMIQTGRAPNAQDARQFMTRYYAAHNAVASEIAREADERRMAALPTAESIFAAYEDNEIAADVLYKGKTFEVVGTVTSIGKDILGTPYLALNAGPNAFGSVQALFPRGDEAKLATIMKGQRLVVRCTGSGKLMNVLLRDCSLS